MELVATATHHLGAPPHAPGLTMRGGCAPWSKSSDLAPYSPKQVVRLGFCPHQEGAPPLRPRVTFPSRGKSPKARQGAAAPGPCPYRKSALIGAALMLAPGLLSATEKDRFATLSWWANRSCFFLWFHRGNTLFFQSVARQILYLRGCLKVLFTSTNTARAQGWGNQHAI